MRKEANILYRAISLFSLVVVSAHGAEYCSIRVLVADASGNALDVPVTLRDEQGTVVAKTNARKNGEADFCDLGDRRYRIDVGAEGSCDFLSIHNVMDNWPHEQTIKVVVNSCGGDVITASKCVAVLRIRSEDGSPLAGVVATGYGPAQISDSLGRIFLGIGDIGVARLTLSKPSYADLKEEIQCEARWRSDREIIMRGAVPK